MKYFPLFIKVDFNLKMSSTWDSPSQCPLKTPLKAFQYTVILP